MNKRKKSWYNICQGNDHEVVLRTAFRFSCLFVAAMLLMMFIGIGFVLVVEQLHKKIILGLLMIAFPLAVIFLNRRAFSSKVMLLIDKKGITDYRRNLEGKIILWSNIRMITLSRAIYLAYGAVPARFVIHKKDSKNKIEIPIGTWDISAKEFAKVIENHIQKNAPHIWVDWTSETLPILK